MTTKKKESDCTLNGADCGESQTAVYSFSANLTCCLAIQGQRLYSDFGNISNLSTDFHNDSQSVQRKPRDTCGQTD